MTLRVLNVRMGHEAPLGKCDIDKSSLREGIVRFTAYQSNAGIGLSRLHSCELACDYIRKCGIE